jgi:periplasmic copper chaperone A
MISLSCSTTSRAVLRLGMATLAAGVAVVGFPAMASAHVTVQPGEVEGGGFSLVSFRVPNERDDANTMKLQVLLPVDQPVGSVQTTPMPGWKITTKIRTLAKPIEVFGSKLSSVVSQVTWTATGHGLQPGQFLDFDLSMGPLPESGEMVFRALQTYSGGEQVNWNEVAADDSVELEHPAPVLTLTEPATAERASAPSTKQAASDLSVTSTGNSENSQSEPFTDSATPTGLLTTLSVAALLVSLGALIVAWRRTKA